MTLNQFANKLAEIHNEHGLLIADGFDQDTLFKMQDEIADLLIDAYRDGSISNNTISQFNHVFTVNK